MRLSTIVATAALALLLPAAARAQSIDPGFSRAQVEARLGKPAAERTVGAYVYLFYNNGCEVSCGQHDIVVLRDGKVADAIFRGTKRSYTGQSSSPSGRVPKHKREAKKAEPRPVG
jgi:hypothetical protein